FTAYLLYFRYGCILAFLYAVLLALGNLRRPRKWPSREPSRRFAALIPAHNEQYVIADLVRSLREADYPPELLTVFVIADNCTDRTAAQAARAGAQVWERDSGGESTKGAALRWGISQIPPEFDAVVILDADNLVSRNFLRLCNNALCAGARLIQSNITAKNPKDNWLTRALHLQQEVINSLWHAGKQALGLGNYLVGTGICVDRALLDKVGWEGTCLCEDLEFTCRMALEGVRVTWLRDALAYDEKPTDLAQAWTQQQRWVLGNWQCFQRFFVPILLGSLLRRRRFLLDLAVYLFAPVWVLLNLLYLGANTLNSVAHIVVVQPSPLMALFSSAFGLLYFAAGLRMARIPILRNVPLVIMFLVFFPLLGAIQVVIGLLLINEKRWYHTKHGAKLDPRIELGE
ncbi:MAG TPA: glycosyltransferase family 2 protein, partial [Armatimonadota bacterium]